jgi:P-type Ca2+ transporter type 2C
VTISDAEARLKYWWTLPREKITEILKTNQSKGLAKDRILEQRSIYGSNILQELKPTSMLTLFIEGIKQPMMILLISIAFVSLVFGELLEASVMIFVVAAYISVEFINKLRTERTMTRLRELTQPTSKVIRDGESQQILTSEIVVGDLIILTSGVRVPADSRLIQASGLVVNEAALTGESFPVMKKPEAELRPDTALIDRVNSVFSGTIILDGEGTAVVIAVGQNSEFGKIAQQVLETRKQQTPLQASMRQLSKTLAFFAIVVSFIIPLIGLLRGLDTTQMVLTWLSLTFLMVPGQPPIIITMALALASFELARRNVIVKRLGGAEGLGSVTSIVTDKTGTLTENRMVVDKIVTSMGEEFTSSNVSKEIAENIYSSLPKFSSDPTDNAVDEALRFMGKKEEFVPVSFEGFSDGHPWRLISYRVEGDYTHRVAGKPELLVDSSKLEKGEKDRLKAIISSEGAIGKRVVAFGIIRSPARDVKILENLEITALVILSDHVRPGVKEAISDLKFAGISTIIVTGDHPATTRFVANEIGLNSEIITGDILEKMSDSEVADSFKAVSIFARVTPSQKLRLVKILQAEGGDVAVVGDGVNDAPAIKSANVGVAMGFIGTDLAKETADLVLTDDNYVHIRDAVEIGRKAIDNFRKGLTYYLSAKLILLSIFLIPLALGLPFPLAPIHIITIELLMDLASSTIFVTEATEPDVLKRPTLRMSDYLRGQLKWNILKYGFFLAAGILFLYLSTFYTTGNLVLSQTVAFVAWLIGHILLALNLKQDKTPLLKQGISSNRFGLFWLMGMITLALLVTNFAPFFFYFKTTFIPIGIWFEILAVVFASLFWIELLKWFNVLKTRTVS